MRLGIRLLLAATSGVLVAMITSHEIDEEKFGAILTFLYFYGVSGALFAIAILWPWLKSAEQYFFRGAALIAASILSFWCAIRTHELIPDRFDLGDIVTMDFLGASLVGAAIVFAAVRLIIGTPLTREFVVSGCIAAVIGGLLFEPIMNLQVIGLTGSFVAWHCLMCGALHFAISADHQQSHA